MKGGDRAKLLEWTRRLIQSRNAILKDIKEVAEGKEGFDLIVTTPTKTQCYIILPELSRIEESLERLDSRSVYIITTNTRKNLDVLLSRWDETTKHNQLCILFVNPDAHGDQKWAIYPATHAALSDPKKLKSGLMTLFLGVEEYKGHV